MGTDGIGTGTVVKAISGFYYVASGNTVFECKARGNFRHSKVSPIVGDRVEILQSGEGGCVVQKILPRRNHLNRPAVANIDKLIIVSSYENPAPDLYLIDRLTAIAVFSNIEPVIVFNKSDMGDFSDFQRIYSHAGFNTYTVSANIPDTLLPLKKEFENCICAMAGNTGVGKSSIINAIFPDLELKTGEVSVALGRGKHTTRHTELFANSMGGYIVDTPGFSSVAQLDNQFEFKQNLAACFRDIFAYKNCKFTTCTHTCEQGCGVIAALNAGLIEKTRHESYVALYNELKNVNKWNGNKG